jgi:phosphomannomutase
MKTYDPQVDSIVDDPLGPLWYRGLAQEDETEEFGYLLDLILKRYDAKRIVIGHTPTGGVVWPRFDQRVVANDSGIAASYGAHTGITAIYGEQRIPLPVRNDGREDYLRAVIEADSNNAELKARLAEMLAPVEEVIAEPDTQATEPGTEEKLLDVAAMMPSPGICQ